MSAEHTLADPPAWSDELASLDRGGVVSQPWVVAAVDWLRFARAGLGLQTRRVLDIGAGAGYAATTFARALPHAEVVAVEPTPEIVAHLRARLAAEATEGRVRVVEAALDEVAELAPADLVWAAHVVHHLDDPVGGLRALRDRLVPGGWAAVAEGGLPMRVLPAGLGVATPSFLLRLEATLSDYFIERWALPEIVVRGRRDWPDLMRDAGLEHVQSKTFVLDLPAPVDDAVRAFVLEHFARVRDLIGDRLVPADRASLDRLLDPGDPASVVRRPDLFLLSAHTVHVAKRG